MVKKKNVGGFEDSLLQIGDVVEIHGLQGAKELNGKVGQIVTYVEDTSRFGIRLGGCAGEKAVRATNLKKIDTYLDGFLNATFEDDLASGAVKSGGNADRRVADGLRNRAAPKLKHDMSDDFSKPTLSQISRSDDVNKTIRLANQSFDRNAGPFDLEPLQSPVSAMQQTSMRNGAPLYLDEDEYPDLERAHHSSQVIVVAIVIGMIASLVDFCSAMWFVWSYLALHILGAIFLTDCQSENSLLLLCASIGLHCGVSISEFCLWFLGWDGADSIGSWSVVMFFSSLLYLHNFWSESVTLPPDYVTSISFFFPMFPAFNAAIVLSCVELYTEWRYFPDYKIWTSAVVTGAMLMFIGQALICSASRTAGRNFWASYRKAPEDEEVPEDYIGLEIPDRRIVKEGPFHWERHPAYLGGIIWGVGAEIALCNPIMFLLVGFVVWASFLYIVLEEEQELYDEFNRKYARYASLTPCWIPMFNSLLETAAFQRQIVDSCDGEDDGREDDSEDCQDGDQNEDDVLPTWEGIPRGGFCWNYQFRHTWTWMPEWTSA